MWFLFRFLFCGSYDVGFLVFFGNSVILGKGEFFFRRGRKRREVYMFFLF